MQHNARVVAFKRILTAARRGAHLCADYSPCSTSELPPINVDALSLPLPRSLVPKLLQLGVNPLAAERISGVVSGEILLRLKATLEADFKLRIQRLNSEATFLRDAAFLSKLRSTYIITYQKAEGDWTAYILDNFIPRLLKIQSDYKHRPSPPQATARARPAFNHDAVPMLEQFFSKNPFPSRLEKFELASKCHMQYRQIHVWFQNKRSRLRREGHELKKPEKEHSRSSLGMHFHHPSMFLHLHMPSPAPYPPVCAEDPFPLDSRRPSFELPWPRTRTSRSSRPRSSIDPDTVATMFSKLTLGSHPGEVKCATHRGAHCDHHILGFVTPCFGAPHPALIRKSRAPIHPSSFSTCRSTSSSYTVPARLSHCAGSRRQLHGIESFSSPTVVASVAPPCTGSGVPNIRRRRTLPRRVPKHPPLSRTALEAHETRWPAGQFVTDLSRTSPITSSASSSSGSDVESPLPTPELSTSELPPLEGVLSNSSFSDGLSWLADSAFSPWGQSVLHDDNAKPYLSSSSSLTHPLS
ncbi:hypothetical protein NUW54_g3967 [Trametes sanguinea]|uniref:Uncharacterized protein n=1 Tax=Trametes sanguinea TaxID=158606 RepID=A0ACC1PZA7_9APHY|nr:hypothetical protein NUW54_g3967 [Trametes sanguinea]